MQCFVNLSISHSLQGGGRRGRRKSGRNGIAVILKIITNRYTGSSPVFSFFHHPTDIIIIMKKNIRAQYKYKKMDNLFLDVCLALPLVLKTPN